MQKSANKSSIRKIKRIETTAFRVSTSIATRNEKKLFDSVYSNSVLMRKMEKISSRHFTYVHFYCFTFYYWDYEMILRNSIFLFGKNQWKIQIFFVASHCRLCFFFIDLSIVLRRPFIRQMDLILQTLIFILGDL